MSLQITLGLGAQHRAAAAALYWQAFGGKLGGVLGPDARALAYLERVMQLDHCFAALQDGRLLGIVGFQSQTGSFAGGSGADLRAHYGALRGTAALLALGLVGGAGADGDALMIDGFSVAPDLRGRGIGAALLQAIAEHARQSGHGALQLDVIDTNWRARSFYQRHGFALQQRRTIGPLAWVFGFGAALRMRKDLL